MIRSSMAVNPKFRETIEKDLPQNLEGMDSRKLQALAYKSMDKRIYVGVTLLLYALEVSLSIIVNDLGDIFGFVGTLSATSLCYFLPSILFCRAFKIFASDFFKIDHKGWYITSVINFLIGLVMFSLFLYSNILSL